MKILHIARYARFDLLRITCKLATRVTKWSAEDSKRLHRLMCYIHSSYDVRQTGWIGNKPGECNLNLFCDADFAGDVCSQKSTSGVHLALQGLRTYFPLHGQSKKQTAVAFSTPEAELIAGLGGYQKTMLPALDMWDTICPDMLTPLFHEDNQAMIHGGTNSGKNPTMRHIGRVHRVSLAWLHERLAATKGEMQRYCSTKQVRTCPQTSTPSPLKISLGGHKPSV